jgi:hypothetical protein
MTYTCAKAEESDEFKRSDHWKCGIERKNTETGVVSFILRPCGKNHIIIIISVLISIDKQGNDDYFCNPNN